MQKTRNRNRKIVAAVFLLIFSIETFYPSVALALTSGPVQPEMTKFTPAGTGDLVDLFSGNFTENIPLLDVEGYPVNLSYHSGSSAEEEASWVGAGWTLNPGSVNRNLRGLPDDFNGDPIQKTFYNKEFRKAGGDVLVKPTFWGTEITNPPTFKIGVYKDNYYGFGATVGAGISFKLAKGKDTKLTAGLDFSSDSRDGVNISPSLSLDMTKQEPDHDLLTTTISGSLLYNTRAGLKSYSLDASFNPQAQVSDNKGSKESYSSQGSYTFANYTHYFGQSYTPAISMNSRSSSTTFSLDFGPYFFGGYLGLGGSGYVYKEHITDKNRTAPAYGYLNYQTGKGNINALLDFNREKDGVFIPSAPSIGLPVATQDMFSVTSQSGSAQFRPFAGGNYMVFDPKHSNTSVNDGAKLTVGGGNMWQLGGRLDYTHGDAITKKWDDDPNIKGNEFSANTANPLDEPVYFKRVGEPTQADNDYLNKMGGTSTEEIKLGGFYTLPALKSHDGAETPVLSPIKRDNRDKRKFNFSYLTASQARLYGFNRGIPNYPAYTLDTPTFISREDTMYIVNPAVAKLFPTVLVRKPHHISEITVTDDGGKRMIYGVPVYNTLHQEFSFAVSHPTDDATLKKARRTGMFTYSTEHDIEPKNMTEFVKDNGNNNGRDGMMQKTATYSYATSWLLSGIVSPDYVDVTNNGISDDDRGTAYKFNYSRLSYNYKWRAPFGAKMANFSDELLADKKDDKASIVYGERELWYLRGIESKNMIAIFSFSNRHDGFGVTDQDGTIQTAAPLQKLDAIDLYVKADWLALGKDATPIKTAHFVYDYSTYLGMPNTVDPASSTTPPDQNGKLTLKQVYFTFGKSTRGQTNPYIFNYNTALIKDAANSSLPGPSNDAILFNDNYLERQTDRWGTYKQDWYNPGPNGPGSGGLTNSEYPYSLQKNAVPTSVDPIAWSDVLDRMASKWQLNEITTPTGSVIKVTYETKDYAYVQDQDAMQMYFIQDFQDGSGNSVPIPESQYIVVKLPVPLSQGTKDEFNSKYLDDTKTIYYKVFTNMKGDLNKYDLIRKDFNDYVNGYASIDPTQTVVSSDHQTVKIFVNKMGSYSPIAKQAWQKIKTEMPQFAYNGYDNSDLSGNDLEIITDAIKWSFANFSEIFQSFDGHAKNAGMASLKYPERSWVRLKSSTVSLPYTDGARVYSKTGGGVRVRKIEVTDNWALMGGAGAKTANYGTEYNYTTTAKDGSVISSGVATYEPAGGSEENPFHQVVPYTEKVHWGIDRYHFIEKPYCESYFPAPEIGYSKVTINNYGDDQARETGYIVNEFYTAKDFPTQVDKLPLDNPSSQTIIPLLFFTMATYDQATSQGFKIELNDMHGKQKAVHVFDKGGREITSTEYFYRVQDEKAEQLQLNNDNMPIFRKDGTVVQAATLGSDVDLVSDSRYSRNENIGGSVGIYPGGFAIPFLPGYMPTFGFIPYVSYTNKTYYSTAMVKVISRYGILSKVRTMKNGSSLITENMLWDAETGDVLLTRTQNEFNDYTYAFHYPAYMAYEGMGSAYNNLGAVISNITFNSNASISTSISPEKYLFPGDELIYSSPAITIKAWVMKLGTAYYLIDTDGNFVTNPGTYSVLRSGRRNLLTLNAGAVVCQNNPIAGGTLSLDVSRQILDAKAVTYNEKWSMPQYCMPQNDISYGTVSGAPATCKAVCAGDQHELYGRCGTQIFNTGYTTDGSGTLQYWLSGDFWGGDDCGGASGGTQALSSQNNIVTTETASYGLTTTAADSVATTSSTGTVTTLTSVSTPSGCAQPPIARTQRNNWPLARTGIWTCLGTGGTIFLQGRLPLQTPVRFASCIQVPETKTYYIGLSGDDNAAVYIDNQLVVNLSNSNSTVFYLWRIYPVTITKGQHTITMTGLNVGAEATLGCEIYNNTAAQIASATSYDNLNMIFSTKDVIGQNLAIGDQSCSNGYTPSMCGSSDGTLSCVLSTPHVPILNPYYADMLGNWHVDTTYAYVVNRVQQPALPGQLGGTDIRHSGYYNEYNPFWIFSGGLMTRPLVPDKRWVWGTASTLYDAQGNELENVDHLKRFGSVLFGFHQSLATAVAANARHNEIMYDGFEDYDFFVSKVDGTCSPIRHFDWGLLQLGTAFWASASGQISFNIAHTGNASYYLGSPTTIVRKIGNDAPLTSFLGNDPTGRYMLTGDEQVNGFSPVNGSSYLLSLWVREDEDGDPQSNKIQKLDVRYNGVSLNPGSVDVPVVEGWKRLEVVIPVNGSFQLDLVPSAGVYIDDVRIVPIDGQLKTYVYNGLNRRLVAQLDENNMATFYEYDEEGIPIRVKKETEKGIVTLKENRQSYRKSSN